MMIQRSNSLTGLSARQKILQTAHDLFYRDGIRATGVDRIIANAGVTKVTFYRHFPSKHDLILAFLELRHQQWMAWFSRSLQQHGGQPQALVATLAEWFATPTFRGCAFLNSASEIGGELPAVLALTRQHKNDVAAAIAALLPASETCQSHALALCVAMDGAIVRAQFDDDPGLALAGLQVLVSALVETG